MIENIKKILFYDADCGFCQSSVDWLIKRDTHQKLMFISYQTPNVSQKYPQVNQVHQNRGVQLLDAHGKVYNNEIAIALCLKQLPGWKWLGSAILFPGMRFLSNVGYAFIARNRHAISRFLGKKNCSSSS